MKPSMTRGAAMNVVVLSGRLARDATVRTLPSGALLAQLEVTVPGPEGRREGVPVAWMGPRAGTSWLRAGVEVVVTGRVRRRFFRAQGATASRTEVVADRVVRAGTTRRARAAIAGALGAIEAGAP